MSNISDTCALNGPYNGPFLFQLGGNAISHRFRNGAFKALNRLVTVHRTKLCRLGFKM